MGHTEDCKLPRFLLQKLRKITRHRSTARTTVINKSKRGKAPQSSNDQATISGTHVMRRGTDCHLDEEYGWTVLISKTDK